jgi:membrane-associated protease RseP (regulator of RpoE activity)
MPIFEGMDLSLPTIAEYVVAVVLTAVVFLPLLTLLHELGHAAVALRVTTGTVQVDVGRPPALFRLRLGRLFISFSPVPPRGVPFAGVCMYQRSSRRPLAELALLLAGPAMNALAAAVLGLLAFSARHAQPAWLTLTLTSAALLALVAFLYNMDPRPASRGERMRVEVRRDGPKALRCYRVWRAGGLMQLTPRTATARSEARSGNPGSRRVPDQD